MTGISGCRIEGIKYKSKLLVAVFLTGLWLIFAGTCSCTCTCTCSERGEGASTPTIQVRTLEYGKYQPAAPRPSVWVRLSGRQPAQPACVVPAPPVWPWPTVHRLSWRWVTYTWLLWSLAIVTSHSARRLRSTCRTSALTPTLLFMIILCCYFTTMYHAATPIQTYHVCTELTQLSPA